MMQRITRHVAKLQNVVFRFGYLNQSGQTFNGTLLDQGDLGYCGGKIASVAALCFITIVSQGLRRIFDSLWFHKLLLAQD